MNARACAWCQQTFTAIRSDAITCSKACRQARNRAGHRTHRDRTKALEVLGIDGVAELDGTLQTALPLPESPAPGDHFALAVALQGAPGWDGDGLIDLLCAHEIVLDSTQRPTGACACGWQWTRGRGDGWPDDSWPKLAPSQHAIHVAQVVRDLVTVTTTWPDGRTKTWPTATPLPRLKDPSWH